MQDVRRQSIGDLDIFSIRLTLTYANSLTKQEMRANGQDAIERQSCNFRIYCCSMREMVSSSLWGDPPIESFAAGTEVRSSSSKRGQAARSKSQSATVSTIRYMSTGLSRRGFET